MEARDGVESLGRFEVTATQEKDELVGARAQTCGNVLERRGKIKAPFAFGAIEDRRGFEHSALDAVEDLHARHGSLLIIQKG